MKLRLFAMVAVVCGAGVVLLAQLTPNASVQDFRLPGFNKGGFKIWESRGSQGRYINENRVEVTALDVKRFVGDEAATLDTEITSPLAIVQPDDKKVFGPGQIRAVGQGWEIFGDDWTYDLDTKTIVIRQHVVVTFAGNIGNILK
jgi:hypothetical protein